MVKTPRNQGERETLRAAISLVSPSVCSLKPLILETSPSCP